MHSVMASGRDAIFFNLSSSKVTQRYPKMKMFHQAIRHLLIVAGVTLFLAQFSGCGGSDGPKTVFDNATEEQIQAAMERGGSDEKEAELAKAEEEIEE